MDVSVVLSLVRYLIFATGNLKCMTECYRKASVYTGIDFGSHLCILRHRILLVSSANQIYCCSWFGVCVRNFKDIPINSKLSKDYVQILK